MAPAPKDTNLPTARSHDSFQQLRKRAIEKVTARFGGDLDRPAKQEDSGLLEELRIHQIELEMQNEELRRAQADLENSRARYFDLYDLAPVGYITVDDRDAVIEMNLRASALFGANRSALARRGFTQSIAGEDQDIYFSARKELLRTGDRQVCELRMARVNLPHLWARLEMSLAQEGGASVLRVVIVDITERKLAEQRFEAFMRFSPAGASIVDEEGRYVFVNPAVTRHIDRDPESWIGKSFAEVWPAATARWLKERHAVSLRSGAVTTDSETLRVGSQERAYQVLRFPFAGANGTKLVGSIWLDVTERQRLEELRVANVKLATEKKVAEDATHAKSQFLSAMSHEIRTPLNGVVGMAGLLLHTDLTAEQRGHAQIVADSAEALLGLVNNILDFSKIEAGKLELDETSFDLERLIDDVLDLMSFKAHEKSLALACRYPIAAPCRFLGDAGRLRQILMNFLSNAIKFTPAGHVLVEVDVTAEGADADRQIAIAGALDGAPVLRHVAEDAVVERRAVVRFAIRDTGIGIPKENLKHLFTRFSQADPTIARRFGGTGLGLSIVKQIVELMGGQLGATSVEGEGSNFYCELSLKIDPVQPRPLGDDGRLAGACVLVAGGQHIARLIVSEWCRGWGMNVAECEVDELSRITDGAATEGQPFQIVIINGDHNTLLAMSSAVRSHGGAGAPKLVFLVSDPLEKTRELVADAVFSTPLRARVFYEKLCELTAGARLQSLSGPRLSYRKPAAVAKAGEFKVLVTDDNPTNQKLTCALLARLGCDVDTADNGVAAVQKISQQEYGLVFMDCVMPEMDGFAATTAIRSLAGKGANVPIIALTASATIEDREHCFEVGMNDFISKPIRSEQLARCLAKWWPRE
jgi:two-component system sensor histidine kinase/response regulator